MYEFKEKIKKIRLQKGLKQAEVARIAGIKQSSFASIEKPVEQGGTKAMTIETGKGIAKALMVSFNELFDIDTHTDFLKMELENANKALKSLLDKEINDNKRLEKNVDLLNAENERLNAQNQGLRLHLDVKDRMIVILFNKLTDPNRELTQITGAELQKEAFNQLQTEFPEVYENKEYNPFTGTYETKKS